MDIAYEKDKIERAIFEVMNKNKFGNIEKEELQAILDDSMGENAVYITENGEDFLLQIKVAERCYQVSPSGELSHLGNLTEVFGLMQNLEIGENILNLDNIEANTYISNENGSAISYSGWSSSEYIDVSNYNKLMVVSSSMSFLEEWNAVYDENKNFIKSINVKKAKVTNETIGNINACIGILQFEENVKYFRVSQKTQELKQTKIYPINDDFNGVLRFYMDEKALANYNFGTNLFDTSNIVEDTYINATTGAQVNYSSWSSTGYIYIGECEKLAIVSSSESGFDKYDAFYDENKNYVKNPNISSLTTEYNSAIGYFKILTVPDNVHYIRLSLATSALKNIKIYPVLEKEETPFYKYKKDNIQVGVSLLDLNSIINNTYIETDGSQVSYNGWSSTDYIDVANYKGIIVKNHSDKYNAIYDSQKEFSMNLSFSDTYLHNDILGKVGAQLAYIEPTSTNSYIRLSQTSSSLKNSVIYPVLNSDFDKCLNFTVN